MLKIAEHHLPRQIRLQQRLQPQQLPSRSLGIRNRLHRRGMIHLKQERGNIGVRVVVVVVQMLLGIIRATMKVGQRRHLVTIGPKRNTLEGHLLAIDTHLDDPSRTITMDIEKVILPIVDEVGAILILLRMMKNTTAATRSKHDTKIGDHGQRHPCPQQDTITAQGNFLVIIEKTRIMVRLRIPRELVQKLARHHLSSGQQG